MKLTALNTIHKKLGAKLGSAAGWEVALSFSDLVSEHNVVRNSCGLTDFSTMGAIDVKGPDSAAFLNFLAVNEVAKIPSGKVVYSTFVNEEGKVFDDTTVFKLSDEHFMVVPSTGKHDITFAWMQEHGKNFKVYLTDMVSGLSIICIQGPESRSILKKLSEFDVSAIKYFHVAEGKIADTQMLVSRTGFTGELGYELYVPNIWAVEVWEKLMEAGKNEGIAPVGISACSATLRLEKAYMGGPELSDSCPLELPLSWTVKLQKESFIGKEALLAINDKGVVRKLVGFEIEGNLPASGSLIIKDGREVGKVTSAAFGPTVQKKIGLGFVSSEFANVGEQFTVALEGGQKTTLVVVPVPFYDPEGMRLRS